MNAFEYAIVRAVHQAKLQLAHEVNERRIEECKFTIQIWRPVVERIEQEEQCRSPKS